MLPPTAHGAPVYIRADLRAIEAAAVAVKKPPQLREPAGIAAGEIIARELSSGRGKSVLVLAGPSNNRGDAFVVARHPRKRHFKVAGT